jgi:hypothetical protein
VGLGGIGESHTKQRERYLDNADAMKTEYLFPTGRYVPAEPGISLRR